VIHVLADLAIPVFLLAVMWISAIVVREIVLDLYDLWDIWMNP
jgi:hypothetical protein